MGRNLTLLLLVVLFVLGIGYWRYSRPIPVLKPTAIPLKSPLSAAVKLSWPSYGQAAFGAVGYGVLDQSSASSAVPIASVAKTITALAILQKKPITAGQRGPNITITDADVQSYRDYLAKEGSVVPVAAGEQINEYQALQAMMLPSANNIADTAARWAFGSLEAYLIYANQFVKSLGMAQTTITDASGFSPQTVSTAKDLVLLGQAALQNTVLAGIVNQSQSDFPLVGMIKNVNWLLGTDGILGIKTGETDQAKGCYLFAAKRTTTEGQTVTIIGAILGAPTRNQAMADSRNLIASADNGFESTQAVSTNQAVARYDIPWGGSVDVVTKSDISLANWKGKPTKLATNLKTISAPAQKGVAVGTVRASSGSGIKSATAITTQPINPPSWIWRVFR